MIFTHSEKKNQYLKLENSWSFYAVNAQSRDAAGSYFDIVVIVRDPNSAGPKPAAPLSAL